MSQQQIKGDFNNLYELFQFVRLNRILFEQEFKEADEAKLMTPERRKEWQRTFIGYKYTEQRLKQKLKERMICKPFSGLVF